MPAHKTRGQIGKALKSDGSAITSLDRLGNMAVDELAKSAARASRVPELTRNRAMEARSNALAWRSRLGRVTYASQNFPVVNYNSLGEPVPTVRRDSDGKPQAPDNASSSDGTQQCAQPQPPRSQPMPANDESWTSTCGIMDKIFNRAPLVAKRIAIARAEMVSTAKRLTTTRGRRLQQCKKQSRKQQDRNQQQPQASRCADVYRKKWPARFLARQSSDAISSIAPSGAFKQQRQADAVALCISASEHICPRERPASPPRKRAKACSGEQACEQPMQRIAFVQQLTSQIRARRYAPQTARTAAAPTAESLVPQPCNRPPPRKAGGIFAAMYRLIHAPPWEHPPLQPVGVSGK